MEEGQAALAYATLRVADTRATIATVLRPPDLDNKTDVSQVAAIKRGVP